MSPTGYTSDLYDGKPQTFPEFAMQCARAFGALITMRDDPSDAEIPDEIQPSDYHVKALTEAEARLAEVEAWSPAEARAQARHAHELAMQQWRGANTRNAERLARYRRMLTEVEAWTPPTKDHRELKTFMAEQLTRSIDFDGLTWEQPSEQDPVTYRVEQRAKALRDIGYHTTEQAKEVERARQRTEWVRALRNSLPVLAKAQGDSSE